MDRLKLARAYVQAQSGAADALSTIKDALMDAAILKLPRSTVSGRDAILAALTAPDMVRGFGQAEWGEPLVEGDRVCMTGKLPLRAILGGYSVALHFDANGRISYIEQDNLPAPPITPSELSLPEPVQVAVNDSYVNGAPMLVASVSVEGQPLLSLRGSFQAYSPTALAFWARNAEGGTIASLDLNNRLTAFLRDPKNRTNLMFYGRGRVCANENERRTVYDNSPEPERLADPQYKGQGVIMDLEKVEGTFGGERVKMELGAGAVK
jgi:hypothetical protein